MFQVVHSIGRSVSETSFINNTGNVAVANKLYILFVSGIILTLCVCVGIDLLLFSISRYLFVRSSRLDLSFSRTGGGTVARRKDFLLFVDGAIRLEPYLVNNSATHNPF